MDGHQKMRYFITVLFLTAVLAGCKTPTGGTIALFAEAATDSLNMRKTDISPMEHSARQISPEKKLTPTSVRDQKQPDTLQEQPLVVDTASTEKKTKPEVKEPGTEAVETEDQSDPRSETEDTEKSEEATENGTISDDKTEIDPATVEPDEFTDLSDSRDQDQEKVAVQVTNDAARDSLMNALQAAEDEALQEKQKLTEQLTQQQKAKEQAELERNELANDFKQLQDEIDALAEALSARVEEEKRATSEKRSEPVDAPTSTKQDRRPASDRADRQNDYRQEQGLSNEDLLLRLTALQVLGRQSGGQTVIVSSEEEKSYSEAATKASEPNEPMEQELKLLRDSLSSVHLAMRRYKALAELKLDSVGRSDNGINQRYLDNLRAQTDSLNNVLERMEQMNNQRPPQPVATAKPDTVYAEVIKEVVREAPVTQTKSIELVAYYNRGAMVARNQAKIIEAILSATKENAVDRIKLSSHTDRSGNADVNLEFSRRRLEIFHKALTDKGIDDTLIFSQHFGSRFASQEVVEEERRIEVTIVLSNGKN